MYRGKQYYYLENGLFYRHKGIKTHNPDFFFPGLLNVDKTKPANAAVQQPKRS